MVVSVVQDLPTLQNHIKRDPVAYKEEFIQQYQHFDSELQIFRLNIGKKNDSFCASVNFLSHVAQCYPKEMAEFPDKLFQLLDENAESMHLDTRKTLVQSLILMRNRGLIEIIPLLKKLFSYFRINDKQLRALIFTHIISDITSCNDKKINDSVNRALKSYMYELINNDNELIARKALDVMVELYRRQIWIDEKSVNVIATACLSKHSKVSVGGIRFFLGIEDIIEDDEEKAKEEEEDTEINRHLHSKKTAARERNVKKQVEQRRKKMRDKSRGKEGRVRFPCIELVYDPQTFTEKLLSKLRQNKEAFNIRMLMMNLISRFIGYHKLTVFSFFTYMQSYMNSHQENVTRLLVYVVQACHDYIPAEELIPIVKLIANNFVNDRSRPEAIALGINTIREIFRRIPLLFEEEEMAPLIQDIIDYKSFKDKGVVMASRNFLNNVREVCPHILKKKDRGKVEDRSKRPLSYGEQVVVDKIEGTDMLEEALDRGEINPNDIDDDMEIAVTKEGNLKPVISKNKYQNTHVLDIEDINLLNSDNEEEEEEGIDDDNDDMDELVPIDDDDDDEEEEEEDDENKEEEEEENEDEEEDENSMEIEDENEDEDEEEDEDDNSMDIEEDEGEEKEETDPTKRLEGTKILSQRDLDVIKSLRKKKNGERNSDSSDSEDDNSDNPYYRGIANDNSLPTVLDPTDLLGEHKKRKMAIEERRNKLIESRVKFTPKTKGGGTTNKEKLRTKNFQMVQKSYKVQSKLKLSIKQQRAAQKRKVRRLIVLGKKAQKRRRI
ncbi:hypothetical protein WA158_002810 [Blastocystis sp. Blastoise]